MRGTRSRKWPTNWGVLAPHMPPSSLTRRGLRCFRRRPYARFSRRTTSIFFSHRALVKLALQPPRQTPVNARGKDREQGRMNQGLSAPPKKGTVSAGSVATTRAQRERRDGRWRFALTHTARRVMATAKAWASRTCLATGKERSAVPIVHPAALAEIYVRPPPLAACWRVPLPTRHDSASRRRWWPRGTARMRPGCKTSPSTAAAMAPAGRERHTATACWPTPIPATAAATALR